MDVEESDTYLYLMSLIFWENMLNFWVELTKFMHSSLLVQVKNFTFIQKTCLQVDFRFVWKILGFRACHESRAIMLRHIKTTLLSQRMSERNQYQHLIVFYLLFITRSLAKLANYVHNITWIALKANSKYRVIFH